MAVMNITATEPLLTHSVCLAWRLHQSRVTPWGGVLPQAPLTISPLHPLWHCYLSLIHSPNVGEGLVIRLVLFLLLSICVFCWQGNWNNLVNSAAGPAVLFSHPSLSYPTLTGRGHCCSTFPHTSTELMLVSRLWRPEKTLRHFSIFLWSWSGNLKSVYLAASLTISGHCECSVGPHFPGLQTVSPVWCQPFGGWFTGNACRDREVSWRASLLPLAPPTLSLCGVTTTVAGDGRCVTDCV